MPQPIVVVGCNWRGNIEDGYALGYGVTCAIVICDREIHDVGSQSLIPVSDVLSYDCGSISQIPEP